MIDFGDLEGLSHLSDSVIPWTGKFIRRGSWSGLLSSHWFSPHCTNTNQNMLRTCLSWRAMTHVMESSAWRHCYLSISVTAPLQHTLPAQRTGSLHNFNAQSALKTLRCPILNLIMTRSEGWITGLEAWSCPSTDEPSVCGLNGEQAKPETALPLNPNVSISKISSNLWSDSTRKQEQKVQMETRGVWDQIFKVPSKPNYSMIL